MHQSHLIFTLTHLSPLLNSNLCFRVLSEARLSNWIKERQDKILAEKNQTNAPEGGGELTLVAVTRPDYSHKEKKQDDASVQSSVKNDSEMDQES